MNADNSFLRQYVYNIISEIIEAKQGVVEPCLAHIDEIRNSINVEVLEILRNLYREGVIEYRIDLNKKPMFKIKGK